MKTWTSILIVGLLLAAVVGNAPACDFLFAPVRGATRTNGQLVQDIGTRADAWATRKGLTGTPQQLGTAKHGYAQRLLNRYQGMYGDRGLVLRGAWFMEHCQSAA